MFVLFCFMIQKKGIGEAGENNGKMRAVTFNFGLGIRLYFRSALYVYLSMWLTLWASVFHAYTQRFGLKLVLVEWQTQGSYRTWQ